MGGSVAIELAVQRPDLVSELVIGEGNVTPGGGMATKAIAQQSFADFIAEGYPQILTTRRAKAQDGDSHSAFLFGAWSKADPVGLHGNSTALVNVSDDFMQRFLTLPVKRSFIYGERSYPGNTGTITPDAPDPELLGLNGVTVEVVPDAGHSLMRDNLDGFVSVLNRCLARK